MHTSSAVSGAPTYVRPGGGALGVNDSLLFGLSALVWGARMPGRSKARALRASASFQVNVCVPQSIPCLRCAQSSREPVRIQSFKSGR